MSKDPVPGEYQRAKDLETNGKIPEAVAIAQWICAHHPRHEAALPAAALWAKHDGQNPAAMSALGTAYMLRGDYVRAIQGFGFVLRLKPDDSGAYAALAACLNKTGDITGAMTMAQKSIALNPDDASGIVNMIDALYSMGEFENALKQATAALKKYPKNPVLHMLYGRACEAMGDVTGARRAYELAIKLDPESPTFRAALFSAALTDGDEAACATEAATARALFDRKPHYKNMMQHAWRVIDSADALATRRPRTERGKILDARNIEHTDTLTGGLSLHDKTDDAWLYHIHDMTLFTTDFIPYDDNAIYLNTQLTSVPFRFVMASGLNNAAYVENPYPSFTPDKTDDDAAILLGGSDNYYHWIIDYLPRLAAVLGRRDYAAMPVYMLGQPAQFQIETLELLGIGVDRLRYYPAQHMMRVRNMFMPYVPGRPMKPSGEPDKMKPNDNPLITRFLHGHLRRNGAMPRKRYFISRADAKFRRCVNEEAIFKIAQSYGFEKLRNEGKTFAEQLDIYADADAIMGPHGAGFTNMVFAPSDAKIIEFFPKNRRPAFYSSLAKQTGQPYFALEGPIMRTFADLTPDFGDFTLDEGAFAEFMRLHF